MGPLGIAALCLLALAGLVVVVELTRNPGTRAAPRRALDATPAGWGSMTLDPDPEAPSRALEVAHEGCLLDLGQIRTAVGSSQTTRQTITDDPWAGLPEWAHPLYKREAPYGWESGAGTARDGGGWDFHEWDPWQPAPDSDVQPDPYIDTIAAEHVSEYDPYPWAPSRLADTGDVMDARLAADVAAELHRQDADAELFLVGLAERHGLAVSR